MYVISRLNRTLTVVVQIVGLTSLAAAALPPPNGRLSVEVVLPFTPNPATPGELVRACFGLFLTDNTLRQEAQNFGIEKQTITAKLNGTGGAIEAVRLLGSTLLPGGTLKEFDHTFTNLQPGKSQVLASSALKATLNNTRDEVVIEGGKTSPIILLVEVQGRYDSAGDKEIFLHAAVQPVTAKVQAVGQAQAPGKVEDDQIVGPRVVPSFSEYKYSAKNVKVGDKIAWDLTNDPGKVAVIQGPNNKADVLVRYKMANGTPTLQLSVNGKKAAEKNIVVVRADISPENLVFEPKMSAQGEAIVEEGILSTQAKNNDPKNFVIEHDPGSDVAAFTPKGVMALPREPIMALSPPKATPGNKITFTATLSIPKTVKPDAFEQIQIGLIQVGQAKGKADYEGKKESRVLFFAGQEAKIDPKGFRGLDWNPDTGTWPWFAAQIAGTKPFTWNSKSDPQPQMKGNDLIVTRQFIFGDSPRQAFPKFWDGVDANGKNPLVTGEATKLFTLYYAARTLDKSNNANALYYEAGRTQWLTKFEIDSQKFKNKTGTNVTLTNAGAFGTTGKDPFLVPVNLIPLGLVRESPFVTWVPPVK